MEDIELPVDISEVHSYDGVGDSLHYDALVLVVVAGAFIDADDVAHIKSSSPLILIGIIVGVLLMIVIVVMIVLMVMKTCGCIRYQGTLLHYFFLKKRCKRSLETNININRT